MEDKVTEKMNKGREYRDLQINIAEVAETPEQEYRVEGYASTYDDLYTLYTMKYDDGYTITVQEEVDRHAFDNADMTDVIMQYDHQGRVFARISNGTLTLNKDDEKGLHVDAYLGGTETGRQLYEEIKGGYTRKMSFGFTVDKDNFEQTEATKEGEVWTRRILSVGKVFDVSAVSLPANDYTAISARKYCEGVIADIESERTRKAQEDEEKRLIAERKKALELRIKALRRE